jgi:hypothetical protein
MNTDREHPLREHLDDQTATTERRPMNTRLSYRYVDKTNCRQFTSIIVAGTITWAQIAPYLVKQGSFIPGKVGLEDLQYRFALPGIDHAWHQITSEDVRPTEAAPTVAVTAEELADRFATSSWEVSGMIGAQPARAPAQPDTLDRAVAQAQTTSGRVRKLSNRAK